MAKQRIVCFGPGPKFKGGIANYNTSLAIALDKLEDTEVHIVSWTQQYPAIIPREFIDKKSKADLLEGTDVKVHYITNYNNPRSWAETVKLITSLNPDKVVFQWSIAIQGLPIGRMITGLKKSGIPEIVVDLHFVVQKEGSVLDRKFTKLGINKADKFVVHAEKTFHELEELFPEKQFNLSKSGILDSTKSGIPVLHLFHPVYDLFKEDPNFDREAFKTKHGLKKHVFLFFGFIRKYKGLHDAIEAFSILSKERNDVSLMICGESFWNTLDNKKLSTRIKQGLFGLAKKVFLRKQDDERNYNPLELIEQFGIAADVKVFNDFIPNEDVHLYFQASDCGLLFYEYATPSGIESMCNNFGLPILATRVGHFPEVVEAGVNGYLANAEDVKDMAKVMEKFIQHPIPSASVKNYAKKLSWHRYASVLCGLE